MYRFCKLTVLVLITFTISFIASPSIAEDAKWTVTSYITKVERITVADHEKHILLLLERRGLADFENGDVAAYHTRATCDLYGYSGLCNGYSDLTYMDKSQTIIKYQLKVEVPDGKKLPYLKGTGEFIKGTGRFEGIEGTVTFSGHYVTLNNKVTRGDMIVKASGSYKLSSR